MSGIVPCAGNVCFLYPRAVQYCTVYSMCVIMDSGRAQRLSPLCFLPKPLRRRLCETPTGCLLALFPCFSCSGTLSYLFNTYDGVMPFSRLVQDARASGYTEPDPRDDLGGMDVARKVLYGTASYPRLSVCCCDRGTASLC